MKGIAAAGLVLALTGTARADGYEEHDYLLSCSGCHRADGTGSRLVPSLHDMRELAAVPGARQYWVQVPGAAQAPLSSERLAALLNWLVERFTGEAPNPRYTPREVARLRRTPLRDPLAKRRALLSKAVRPKIEEVSAEEMAKRTSDATME